MWNVFVTAVNAVLPIVILILLGYFLKRIGLLNKDFLKIGNKLVFNVFLPCMLFVNIYDEMNSFADIPWGVVIYSVIAILLLFGIGLLICILTTKQSDRRGVILQCTFRSNYAIIGLSLVGTLGGDAALAGIVSAFSIPAFNILAVVALTVFQKPVEEKVFADALTLQQTEEKPKGGKLEQVKKILLGIVKNPLIIGVFVGLVFVAIREIEVACCGSVAFSLKGDLKFLYTPLSWLKNIASPFALIILGGQFEFKAIRGLTKEIIVGTVARLIIAPLVGIGGAALVSAIMPRVLEISSAAYPTLVALFATPVAVSSAIMAGQMGGDEQLATQLVVWTSIGSIVTVFFTVFILMSCGLIAV